MYDDYAEEIEAELIEVKAIRSKGQVTLVEYDDAGRTRRTLLPRNVVIEGEDKKLYVDEDSLDMGIPYGVNWEARLRDTFTITGAKVAEQLEVSGIWTKEDYINNPSVVQQAVLGAARGILTELSTIGRSIPN